MKHFLSILDLSPESLSHLVNRGIGIVANDRNVDPVLSGKVLGLYFRKPSTRTRTSFAVATLRLGGEIVAFGPNDLQVSTGESVKDTARVLSYFLNALVIRTNESVQEMQDMAQQSEMAIINAMSANEHPTQVIADFITLREAFGRLEGIDLLYIGEGNNTATSLALAVAKTAGMRATFVSPKGYGLPEDIVATTYELAARSGAVIEVHDRVDLLEQEFDAVYTTRWETMGVSHAEPNWKAVFEPYRVTPALMAQASKTDKTVFLHDLPAIRGSEVLDEVLDCPQSLAFRQARHKLTAAMSVLSWLFENEQL